MDINEHFKSPPPLELNGSVDNWNVWKQQFDFYLKATKMDKEDQSVKIAILMTTMALKG